MHVVYALANYKYRGEVAMAFSVGAVRTFFQLVFTPRVQGYACLAFRPAGTKIFEERFYEWPAQIDTMCHDVNSMYATHNVYFCPQLFEKRRRQKDLVKTCPNLWADLDTCTPDKLMVEPSVLLESSPGRFQALWVMESSLSGNEAEDASKRIAYHHAMHGADRSGWDLTQLLRVPYTCNFKYGVDPLDVPIVTSRKASTVRYTLHEFAVYPEVKGSKELTLPLPEASQIPQGDGADILQQYRRKLNPNAFGLYSTEPVEDWSKALWNLLMFCFEAGMNREEVLAVADQAACNKYRRDGRPLEALWRDVCRAYLQHDLHVNSIVSKSELPSIISDEEQRDLAKEPTFVEAYIEWASNLGDAAVQYHQAGAFIILSALLAGNVVLPTSYGTILPNLWFMIMADTTLTRKSTAMDIAMDLLTEVDSDVLLATDGSIEGLMTSLALRAGVPSIFLRDEFSGLIEAMVKKDYYAGMAETLTKLYDGKPQRRVLRKEIIHVDDPILILFAGGIKTRIQSLLTYEQISSGFIPRFVFLTAESDIRKVRPLGPPSERDWGERELLLDTMHELADHYRIRDAPKPTLNGKITLAKPKKFRASLTKEAWARYNKFEQMMLAAGLATNKPDLMTPMYARLGVSALKAAVLLAASRQLDERIVVEECDIVRALGYATQWRDFATDVVNGIGTTSTERELQKVLESISRSPGISRSRLMQNHHLTARTADQVFSTLEQRGLITRTSVGKSQTFYANTGAMVL